MIKTETLRCFATVAQLGNLSDAADRLGRTQSALSMTLKQLEDHLGARLFEGERKNRLTPLGQEVLGLAQRQLRQFDDTIAAIETAASAPQGHLRVAAIPSAAGLALPSVLAKMARLYPRVTFEVRDMDSQLVLEALLNGQADIGLASGRPMLSGIHSETLFDDSFGLVCARNHDLAKAQHDPSIADVFAHAFVRNSLCTNLSSDGVKSALQTSRITVHNTHTLIAMVRSGLWVTILPQSVVQVAPKELVFRDIPELQERRLVSMLVRERSRFPELAGKFAQILREHDWSQESSSAPYPEV